MLALLHTPDQKNKTAQDYSGAVRNLNLQAICIPYYSAFCKVEVATHVGDGDVDLQHNQAVRPQ
jgi:hypothetical protein